MADDDLFSGQRAEARSTAQPLAARMRPRNLDEVVGQDHLVGTGSAFRTMVESGRPLSMILWGPPGTGKTTLARIVAGGADATFEQLSATSAGVKDVREVLAAATRRLETDRRRTVMFLDEIHRFTKAQQDALLPGVEDGTVILIGATTENPFFEVNSPLISRSTLFRTEALEPADVMAVIDSALNDHERGIAARGPSVKMDDEAREALAERVGGDARLALNVLDMAAIIAGGKGRSVVEVTDVEEALQRRVIRYDKGGDRHYDVISAFIKSMRGSDPDAALYWLHTMLEAGEDPEFIARRMIVLASEDIGLADSSAIGVANDAFAALRVVGLPEAAYALSHAAIYLALAPKSNSVATAMAAARTVIEASPGSSVPIHLRSAATAGQRTLGHGVGYRYPHSEPGAWVDQQHLPDGVHGPIYRPSDHGDEPRLAAGKPGAGDD